MKYFVIEASIVSYGQMAQLITEKDKYNDARMVFHQVRASQLSNPDITYGSCFIVDEQGRMYENEYQGSTDAQPAPEPDSEPSGE